MSLIINKCVVCCVHYYDIYVYRNRNNSVARNKKLSYRLTFFGRHQQCILKKRVEHTKHHDDPADDGH